ncbi:MAG: ABC transporter ATP-binding protein/permease [Alphaproteobacteria bacterium]|nr:ABC transporter ATP-binding protein/permease [Alphaproteobacteria bacterium]
MNHDPLQSGGFTLNLKGFFQLWPYLWPKGLWSARLRLIFALITLLVGKVVVILTPLIFKELVNSLKGGNVFIIAPMGLICAYTATRLISGLMNEFRDAIFAKVSERAMREAGVNVFRHLHNLSLGFHIERKMGALNHIVQKGVKAIEEFMQFSTFSLLPTLIEVLFVIGIFSMLYGGVIAFICALMLIMYVFSTLRITEWRINYIKTMNAMDAEANTKAIDSLINYETVKYFNNEDHEARRYDKALASYEKAAVQSKLSLSVLNTAQNVVTSAGLFSILLIVMNRMETQHFTVGDFVAINAYLLQIFNPLFMVGFAYRQVRLALTHMEQMFNLLDVEMDVQDAPYAKDIALKNGEVTFTNVKFHYQSVRPILKGISFHLPPKQTLAIVGLSGSGKSTIAKLLYRFYDVSGGSIQIDGQDIRSLTQKSLRKVIGIVPQDTVLFNDTIAYNIGYGRPDASMKEIIEVAKRAQIHDFIESLPDKYNSFVGERGLKLSGGEKQRVSIARALLKNPQIFVFDEATSSLDTHTEQEIQKQLESLAKNHTSIIIAHRLSTIVRAHKIIVLKDGHIVEEGTHNELLALNGRYAELWAKQSS